MRPVDTFCVMELSKTRGERVPGVQIAGDNPLLGGLLLIGLTGQRDTGLGGRTFCKKLK